MTDSASKLSDLSNQLGFRLKKQHSGNSQAQEAEFIDIPDEDISIVEHEEDTQTPDRNPKIRFLVLCSIFLLTLGLGLYIFLWGAGGGEQVAKKPDSLPVDTATTEQSNKENAELKAKLAAAQQQADAEKLNATQSQPTPKPTSPPVTATNSAPPTAAKPTATPAKPTTAKTPTIDPQTVALRQKLARELAAIEEAKKASTSQLTALNELKLRSQKQLVAIDRSKDSAQKQLDSIRKLSKQELAKLVALQRQKATAKSTPKPKTVVIVVKPTVKPKPAVNPVAVAVKTQPKPINAEPTVSEKDAIALASFGGDRDGVTTPVSGQQDGGIALEGVQTLQLQPGMAVSGKLASPFIATVGNGANAQKNSLAVVLDRDLQLGGYWRLPAGTAIEFDTQVADNGLIQTVSRRVTYQNTEIKIPAGAFMLFTGNNQPLIAQIHNANSDKLAGADTRVAIYGGIAQAGQAIANTGSSSTVSIGAGTTVASVNNGNANPLAAFAYGAASPLVQTQIARAQSLATKIDQQAQVAFLPIGTAVQIHVAQAVSFSMPTARFSKGEATPTGGQQTVANDDSETPTSTPSTVNPTVPIVPAAVKTPTPISTSPTIPNAPAPSVVNSTLPTVPSVTYTAPIFTNPISGVNISQPKVTVTPTSGMPSINATTPAIAIPSVTTTPTTVRPPIPPNSTPATTSPPPSSQLQIPATISPARDSSSSGISTPTKIATSNPIQVEQPPNNDSRQVKLDPSITIEDLDPDSSSNNLRIDEDTSSPFYQPPTSKQTDIKPNPNSSKIPLPNLPTKTATPASAIVPLPPIQIPKSAPSASSDLGDDLPESNMDD